MNTNQLYKIFSRRSGRTFFGFITATHPNNMLSMTGIDPDEHEVRDWTVREQDYVFTDIEYNKFRVTILCHDGQTFIDYIQRNRAHLNELQNRLQQYYDVGNYQFMCMRHNQELGWEYCTVEDILQYQPAE